MKKTISKAIKSVVILPFTASILLSSLTVPTAFAIPGGPGGPLSVAPHILHASSLVYLFLDGVFLRPGPKGYVPAPAPVGVKVPTLPPATTRVTIDNTPYYTYIGVFYQKSPEGFVVVDAPVQAEITPVPVQKRLTVSIDHVNIHSGPGTEYPVTQQAEIGDGMTLVASTPEWSLVKFQDNSTGWVQSAYTYSKKNIAKG